MNDDTVTEDQCLLCRRWAAADRAERRLEHFTKGGVLLIPVTKSAQPASMCSG
jgi:hypothetical protein